jgi:tetratricopeptide (TPR) repeat protein
VNSRPTPSPALAAILACAGVLASCAPTSTGPSAALRLDAMAQRESERDGAIRVAPVPPGVPDTLAAPIRLGPSARVPLDEAIRAAADREVELPTPPAGASLSAPLQLSAARMYTQARAASLSGDQQAAADLYSKVVAIDPTASEAWSALAAIRTSQGDAPAAAEAWRNALATDPSNARALEQLGLAALRRGDLSDALTLLARARLNDPERVDAALPYLLDAALADALEQSGSLLAAAEAATRAASAPAPFAQPTNEQRRLLALLRQRAFLLRGAGDMRLRLGDPRAAADSYLRAMAFDDTLDAATAARAVYALRRAGAEASAARVLVSELERSQGRIDALHLRLVEHLSDTLAPDIARAYAEALGGIPARAEWPDSPSAHSAAARLDAAGQRSPDAAADVLLNHLATVDADDAATEQLARTLARSPQTLASSLVRLVANDPVRAAQLTSLFARSGEDRAAFETALRERARAAVAPVAGRATISNADAATIALGWLALRTRDAEGALARFDSIPSESTAHPFAQFGRIDALATLGRLADAVSAADALAQRGDSTSRLLAGAANSQLQRNDEAFSLLRSLTTPDAISPNLRSDALILAARTALAVGQTDAAERWLRNAMNASPLREEPYAGLIQIGIATGAQRNQAQLADVARRLRENIPTSRTLRLLQAREFAQQGQALAAIEILTDLLSLDPRDEAAQEQYVATLANAGQLATAESWLRERLESDVAEPSTAVLLARLLVSSNRASDADELLAAQAERFPRSDVILREREAILRGPLENPVAADERALERLADAPPTIDNTLELAEVQARLALWSEAARSVERVLTQPGVALRRDQQERIARTIGLFAASAKDIEEDDARLMADAAGMLVESAPGVPEVVHRARIALLDRVNAPVGEIIDAAEAPSSTNRDLALQLRLGAIDAASTRDPMTPNDLDRLFDIARQGVRVGGAIAPEMLTARIALAVQFDRPDEAIDAIRRAVSENLASETFSNLTRMLGGAGEFEPQGADELAYTVAVLYGQNGQVDASERLYQLALEFNPNHPLSANNYGYGLLERGEDILRAYDLIQRAYAQRPNDVAIVDSMGWARYLVGIYEDTQNAAGERIEGAVSLLQNAAAMGTTPADYVIHEHLGDALWRAGRTQDAIRAWRRAEQLVRSEIDRATRESEQSPALAQYIRTLRDAQQALTTRVAAGARGADGAPPVADAFLDLRDDALKIPIPKIPTGPAAQPGA